MKVVILAGGYGARLGNVTEAIPKPMVRIGNKPLLWHLMRYYASFGHKDFILSVGFKADVIKHFFFNYYSQVNDFTINLATGGFKSLNNQNTVDWNVTVMDTGVDTLKGARLKRLEPHLDDVNFLTYGDGLSDVDLDVLLEFHRSHGKMLTISGVHPPARFGNIEEKNGNVLFFNEKRQSSQGFINGGFMVFNKSLLKYLRADENQDLETETFQQLADDGELMVYKHEGNWECVDTGRDLKHIEQLWKEGKAFWVRG
ncbi:MAG TPA: sugar phosphate nucleotidyltransferase [Candidatus Omnitrophota bacterium]|nr:sugar phosphate nucleotidyltransferase [Candidatus Omnitrophota bacterium]